MSNAETTNVTLTAYEAMLVAAAIDGLAAQLALTAQTMIHGPNQMAACHAVGALRSVARRLPKPEQAA